MTLIGPNNNITNMGIKVILKSSSATKPVKNSYDLVTILNSHQLSLIDSIHAENIIRKQGYYYITGYRRVFLDSYLNSSWKGKYETGVVIEFLYSVMNFDKQISSIILDYLSNIERRIKVRTAYFAANKFGEDFYFNSSYFKNYKTHNDFLYDKYKGILNSGLKENNPVIMHHINLYAGRLPIWVLFEHISFGTFIKFIGWLSNANKKAIFSDIFITSQCAHDISNYVQDTLYIDLLNTLLYCRNRIAHLGRLYDWKSTYIVNLSNVNADYNTMFDSSRSYFNIKDILEIMGMFLEKDDYANMINKISIEKQKLKSILPNPYFSRVIAAMEN